MAIEIVDFPINSMVIFHSYGTVSPEGNNAEWSQLSTWWSLKGTFAPLVWDIQLTFCDGRPRAAGLLAIIN